MKKILVIDDEKDVTEMLKRFLEKKGYIALTAASGEEAIRIIKKEKPQVALLDIRMPGMDGVTTLKEIKKIDSGIGVIMITAVLDEEVAKKCIELGAYDYITKPLSLEYLETALLIKLLDFEG